LEGKLQRKTKQLSWKIPSRNPFALLSITTVEFSSRRLCKSAHRHGPSRRTLELARSETRLQRWMVPVLPWPRRRRRCADAHAGGGPETRERTIRTIPARRFHHFYLATKSSIG
jgi:hypothetical protein